MTITWRGPLLALSLVAVLAFAGCGSSDNSSDTGSATSSQSASTVAGDDGGTATESSSDDSGGGSDEEFCSKLENVGKNLSGQTADASDPQKLAAYFRQLSDALDSADPPAEIKDDWNTLSDVFSTFAGVFEKADFSDPQSLAGMQDDLQKFADKQDEIASAATALSQYAAKNCGGSFG